MVSFTYLLSVAVTLAGIAPGILAQDDLGSADDSLVLSADVPDIITYEDIPDKRDIDDKFEERDYPHYKIREVDPYKHFKCHHWDKIKHFPHDPKCRGNNCFRGFLNGDKHRDGFHCPATAFHYCCQWFSKTQRGKESIVRKGTLEKFASWTDNCGTRGYFKSKKDIEKVVKKIDDVCACTLKHKVRIDANDPYAKLSRKKVTDPVCRQKKW